MTFQVEIFFKEICLNILDAATSSFEQKWLVVEAIAKICSDAQVSFSFKNQWYRNLKKKLSY